MARLIIKNLKAEIASKNILNGVNLTVNSGEIHVLMGPNGSGKSTLAALLLGRPDIKIKSGSVRLDKKDVLALPPNERAAAGLFLGFQHPVALAGVSVGQLLRAAATSSQPIDLAALRRQIDGKMRELNLPLDFLQRSLNDGFSGGEKKRAEILQMSLLQPKIAILDEIDSGVDADAVKIIAASLKKVLKETGCGLLMITHYQNLLRYLEPDFVHIFIDGRVVKSGDKNLAKKIEHDGYKKYKNKT